MFKSTNLNDTRLDILKMLAAFHHGEMIRLQALEEKDPESLDNHTACFNALSSAIGLTQAVGRWRKYEAVPNSFKNVSPLQNTVFRVHYSLVKQRKDNNERNSKDDADTASDEQRGQYQRDYDAIDGR